MEAQLDREELELAGVRLARGGRPLAILGRWARSEGLAGKTGLCLLSWTPHCPGIERMRNYPEVRRSHD